MGVLRFGRGAVLVEGTLPIVEGLVLREGSRDIASLVPGGGGEVGYRLAFHVIAKARRA